VKSAYDYALGEEAVQTFTSPPPRQREKLLRVFDGTTHYPNTSGDYQEPGFSGRPYQVRLIDNLLLTWWHGPCRE